MSRGEEWEEVELKKRRLVEARVKSVLEKSVASTERSLSSLSGAEGAGQRAAEGLAVQRDQLNTAFTAVATATDATHQTQRHINRLSSVFGRLKNRFLSRPIKPSDSIKPLPAHKDKDKKKEKKRWMKWGKKKVAERTSLMGPEPVGGDEAVVTRRLGGELGALDEEVEENLGRMAESLRSLRGLATAVGEEAREQTELLGRLNADAQGLRSTLRRQDRQVQHLLGRKDAKGPASPSLPATAIPGPVASALLRPAVKALPKPF